MSRPTQIAALVMTSLAWSCRARPIEIPQPPTQTMVVLLSDPGSGSVGAATVSNQFGDAELVMARGSTAVSGNQAPGPVLTLSEAEVRSQFGVALSALPPSPLYFTVYFNTGSDELVEESRALIPEILEVVSGRVAPEVAVVGHTDTTGAAELNFQVGLLRAITIRDLLIDAGLDPPSVEATTLGEIDPVVPTADEVSEPRNRRVEIVVR